jgi:hypothetical protein
MATERGGLQTTNHLSLRPNNAWGAIVTLADFATLSTAASGLAVTGSLIYLAMQTHQNAKHTRALIHQGRIAALRDVFLATANGDIAAAMIVTTGGTPTPLEVQRYQFLAISGARIYGWQDTYLQYQNGLLGEDFLRQMRAGAESVMKDRAAREAGEFYRVPGTSFTTFMDGISARMKDAEI